MGALRLEDQINQELVSEALKQTGMVIQGRQPTWDSALKRSQISSQEKTHIESSIHFFDEMLPYAAQLIPYAVLDQDIQLRDEVRIASQKPYTSHLNRSLASLIAHTPIPVKQEDIREYAITSAATVFHDKIEEKLDTEIVRVEKFIQDLRNQHQSINAIEKAVSVHESKRVKRREELLADFRSNLELFATLYAQNNDVSSHELSEIGYVNRGVLVAVDKLSRGRKRLESTDSYNKYTKSIVGPTSIFGIESTTADAGNSILAKIYEAGENGQTTNPSLKLFNGLLDDAFLEDVLLLTDNDPYFEEYKPMFSADFSVPGMMRVEYEAILDIHQEDPIRAQQRINRWRRKDKEITPQIENHVKIIPADSRADTFQWNAYLANLGLKLLANPRKDPLSSWQQEALYNGSMRLAYDTAVNTQLWMHQAVLLNGMPLQEAEQVCLEVDEYMQLPQSRRFTSNKSDLRNLPKRLHRFNNYSSRLKETAEDKKKYRDWKKDFAEQFDHMALTNHLTRRLYEENLPARKALAKPSLFSSLISYVRGTLD